MKLAYVLCICYYTYDKSLLFWQFLQISEAFWLISVRIDRNPGPDFRQFLHDFKSGRTFIRIRTSDAEPTHWQYITTLVMLDLLLLHLYYPLKAVK